MALPGSDPRPGANPVEKGSAMSIRSRRLVPLSILILVGCDPSVSVRSHTFTVGIEEGVPTARTTGGPRYDDPVFRFEELLTLDQDPSRPESLLHEPQQGARKAGDGCFYIPDSGNCRIAVFDRTGRYQRSIGRAGDGPGEFRSVRIMSIRDGTIHAHDYRTGRVTLYGTDGGLIGHYPVSRRRVDLLDLAPVGEDRLVSVFGRTDRDSRGQEQLIVGFCVLEASGDTLANREMEPVPGAIVRPDVIDGLSVTAYVRRAFASRPMAFFSPAHGVLYSSGTEPELTWYGLDGNVLRRIWIDIPPPPVTESERAMIDARHEREMKDAVSPVSRAYAKARRKHLIVPETMDYWVLWAVDDADFIWLCDPLEFYSGVLTGWPEASRLRVVSAEGEYLGDAHFPHRFGHPANGHVITYRQEKEGGELEVVVHRIVPGVPGLTYP